MSPPVPPTPTPHRPQRPFPWLPFSIALAVVIVLSLGAVIAGSVGPLRGGDNFVFVLIPLALLFGLIVMFPAAFFLFRSRKYRSPEWNIWVRLPIWLGIGVTALAAAGIFFFFTCLATIAGGSNR
jgi:hypothetical protein